MQLFCKWAQVLISAWRSIIRFRNTMYLQVENTINTLRSTILAASRENFYKPKEQSAKKSKVWAGMEDGLKMFKLHRRFLQIDFSFTALLSTHFLFLFTYYEADINQRHNEAQWLLWGLVATSFGLIFCGSLRFLSRREIARARKQQETRVSQLLLQLLLICILPYPHLDEYSTERISLKNQVLIPLKLNHLLVILALTKLIFLLRGIMNYVTPYGNPRHYRVTKMYGVSNNPFYHIRCLFRQQPVILISALYIFCLVLFAYCYRVFQNGATSDVDISNTLWLALLTMTTVGYGDVKPITRMGGAATLVSSYAGVIGTSLFVLSITNNLLLNYGEERALLFINRFRNKRIQKQKSGLFIRICLWRLWQQRKMRKMLPITAEQRQLKRELFKINEQAKNSLKQSSLFQQVMQQQFEVVRSNIDEIMCNCEELLEECSNAQFVECVLKNLAWSNPVVQQVPLSEGGRRLRNSVLVVGSGRKSTRKSTFLNVLVQ